MLLQAERSLQAQPPPSSEVVRVLNCGAGMAENPTRVFRLNAPIEYTRLDADERTHPDVVHDIRDPFPPEMLGAYDWVYASHVLEHVGWRNALGVLNNLGTAAKPGGGLYIVVPDMEWACGQIVKGNYDFAVLGIFYGGQSTDWDYHKCGWTKASLRDSMKACGWEVVKQGSSPFTATVNDVPRPAYAIETVARRYADFPDHRA